MERLTLQQADLQQPNRPQAQHRPNRASTNRYWRLFPQPPESVPVRMGPQQSVLYRASNRRPPKNPVSESARQISCDGKSDKSDWSDWSDVSDIFRACYSPIRLRYTTPRQANRQSRLALRLPRSGTPRQSPSRRVTRHRITDFLPGWRSLNGAG